MNRFCMIIELEKHQVLFEKGFKDDEYFIKMQSDIDGVIFAVSPSYTNESDRNKIYEAINRSLAGSIINSMSKFSGGDDLYKEGELIK